MCKYCEELKPIDNVSNCPTGMFIDRHWWAENGTFFLEVVSDVDIGMGGCINVLTSAKINYCPICGRKLEDTKNV